MRSRLTPQFLSPRQCVPWLACSHVPCGLFNQSFDRLRGTLSPHFRAHVYALPGCPTSTFALQKSHRTLTHRGALWVFAPGRLKQTTVACITPCRQQRRHESFKQDIVSLVLVRRSGRLRQHAVLAPTRRAPNLPTFAQTRLTTTRRGWTFASR